MEIVLVGLNHRTAPLELRERVSFTQEAAKLASEQLRALYAHERQAVDPTALLPEEAGKQAAAPMAWR